MSSKVYIPVVLLLLALSAAGGFYWSQDQQQPPIKIGILHSFTGVMSFSESKLADATLMAIEEINRAGGVMGRRLEPVITDGASDWPTFARQVERLISQEKVSAIFGGYTSASRKTMKPVLERLNGLLFYPVPYEGVEASPNIVYNGASPNQLYVPAVKWCMDNLGMSFFLVGSDYIWPRTVNVLMRDVITGLRGKVVGEEYLLLGASDVKAVVDKIEEAQPQVILSNIVGGTNVAFFKELRSRGITPVNMPVMAFGISEVELSAMDASQLAGNYSCWSYFQSVATDTNRRFVREFKKRFGQDRVVNDSMEAGYFGVHLYAQAVAEAGATDVDQVRKSLADQSYEAPGGVVFIDGDNLHTWKFVRIGRILADGQYQIVWSSNKPVRPVPYPIYRTKSQWESIVQDLYLGWGRQWANPGK